MFRIKTALLACLLLACVSCTVTADSLKGAQLQGFSQFLLAHQQSEWVGTVNMRIYHLIVRIQTKNSVTALEQLDIIETIIREHTKELVAFGLKNGLISEVHEMNVLLKKIGKSIKSAEWVTAKEQAMTFWNTFSLFSNA